MKFPYKKCSQQRIHSLVLIWTSGIYLTDGKVNLKCDIFKKELRLSLSCYNWLYTLARWLLFNYQLTAHIENALTSCLIWKKGRVELSDGARGDPMSLWGGDPLGQPGGPKRPSWGLLTKKKKRNLKTNNRSVKKLTGGSPGGNSYPRLFDSPFLSSTFPEVTLDFKGLIVSFFMSPLYICPLIGSVMYIWIKTEQPKML